MKLKFGLLLATAVAMFTSVAAQAAVINVQIGDRPYYSRGPGYYVGRSYYVWRPGHWAWRHHHRAWIHGHYVIR